MTSEDIIKKGKELLAQKGIIEPGFKPGINTVNPTVPGLGAAGDGITFDRNRKSLKKYFIKNKLIGENFIPDTSNKLFGLDFAFPIIAAPMSGIKTNLKELISEKDFLTSILKGCTNAGTIGMCGDSFDTTSDYIVPEILKNISGIGVCKPRPFEKLKERIEMLKNANPVAIGIDLDGVAGMLLDARQVTRKDRQELEKIRSLFKGPMFLKGIINTDDADLAYETGFDAIVVSNHGGRSIDYSLGSADALPLITKKLKGKLKILVDGGIRSGYDAYIYLALGADAVLAGRTILYGAIGGGSDGVETVLYKLLSDLRRAMIFSGTKNILDINHEMIAKYE